MTALAEPSVIAPPRDLGTAAGSTGSRLLRFALANLLRRPERFALSTLGIALAIMAVVVVRAISIGFASSGSASLSDVLHGARLWVVPAQGIHYDAQLRTMLPDGPAPPLSVPAGWTAQRTYAGVWTSPAGRLAVYGTDTEGEAQVGSAAAKVLGISTGARIQVAGTALPATVTGNSRTVTVPSSVARRITANSWWTVSPPQSMAGRLDVGQQLAAAT
ncbi:MAG TPA: hypothetical protein VE287_11115, partial [Actinopolymorphaceae bacterium]|nr:hypothetical protein [Actinopolymorphaceae bacterium]